MKKFGSFICCVGLGLFSLGCPPVQTGVDGHEEAHFSYTGETGPEFWAKLSADWAACGDGMSQSPIDISGATGNAGLEALVLDYQETAAVLLNNGHTFEVEYQEGSTLTFGGKDFELLQFHFHTPSEHTVDGAAFPMEAHLVHQSADGLLAVIGVFVNAGAENEFLAEFWEEFPMKEGEVETETMINVAELLPANLGYSTYSGSLTTPPCSEIVTWIVLETPIEASQAQINLMDAAFGANARPVLALNGREIQATE